MQRSIQALATLAVVGMVACGDRGSQHGNCGAIPCPPCTAEARNVQGTSLTFTTVELESFAPYCQHRLLTSAADLSDAFRSGSAPASLSNINFAVDRVVLAVSNPAVLFAVDDGAQLVVGEEPACQGIAPRCVAHVVAGTTRNTLQILSCPYRGPNPCLAP